MFLSSCASAHQDFARILSATIPVTKTSHLSAQSQSVGKYNSRGQADYIAKFTSIEQETIIFTWSMCEWVGGIGKWIFTERYSSWYYLQEEWERKNASIMPGMMVGESVLLLYDMSCFHFSAYAASWKMAIQSSRCYGQDFCKPVLCHTRKTQHTPLDDVLYKKSSGSKGHVQLRTHESLGQRLYSKRCHIGKEVKILL